MITMILTQGRAGMLGAIIGLLILLLALKKVKFGIFFFFLGLSFIVGFGLLESLVGFIMRGQTDEVFWNLSTRIIMWEEVLYHLFKCSTAL